MFWIELIRPTRILIGIALVVVLVGPALLAYACACLASDPLPPRCGDVPPPPRDEAQQ